MGGMGERIRRGISRRRFLRMSALASLSSGLFLPGCTAPHKYLNPPGSPIREGEKVDGFAFFKRRIAEWSEPDPVPPEGHVVAREEALAQLTAAHGRDSLTWLGHSAFLIRLGGKTVLTDPFLSKTASPVPPIGPQRYVPFALRIEDIGRPDVILISHNHYDHLDVQTLRLIPGKENIRVIVPLGLGNRIYAQGYSKITELDWHQTRPAAGLEVTGLPAIHFSGRSLFDRNETLWSGFMIRSGQRKVYFAGDTGLGPIFHQLGQKYGPFDLGLVPIGAYEPQAMMQPVHTNPEEAVELARMLRVGTMVGMHWGTVALADEPRFEPGPRFIKAAQNRGFGEDRAWVMPIGQTKILPA